MEDFLTEETTMTVSMTDDKIGNVHFPGGRVRTTHGHGPKADTHAQARTLRFNIDPTACWQTFVADSPWLDRMNWENQQRENVIRQRFKRFKLSVLKNATSDQTLA